MGRVRNFLFIMCDQLRADYLGCYGHPTLETPHLDALAARGVRFTRAYCQSPVCGPSRASFYTGRYMVSHGATWNNVPVSIGDATMGDYLREQGVRTALVGKTHMRPDLEGMRRLGVDPKSSPGVLVSECGFEPFERDDGLHTEKDFDPELAYNRYLRSKGYEAANPWHDFANSAEGPDGEVLSGWFMRNARLPARVAEEDSETAYMTNRAMEFITAAGDEPWCLHLSYIKPHWPYMAPAPYNDMYSANQVLPANRRPEERDTPHPVIGAFMQHEDSRNFQSEEVRQTVIPTYMGLVKQIDDHIGRLMRFLDEQGRLEDTMVVFTADHGDYLGDHWLGEKELFHEEVARIPMIVVDPDPAADGRRGASDDRLVESIDLIPTFLDSLGAGLQPHRLEGRSLLPLLRDGGPEPDWREAAFSEAEYAFRRARLALGLEPKDARAFMVATETWKYVFYEGFRPQLFNLADDPQEQRDLGDHAAFARIRQELHERLFHWLRTRGIRRTMSDETIAQRTGKAKERGYYIGVW
ncbi:MAG TPA: alkaline phosphatase family protein [Alphaproteobacteria bacterium]|nr:alkaline phosphatase family protein [Alphaproteobacteria bacterium]